MPSRLRLASFLAMAQRAGVKEQAGRVEHVPFALEAGHAAGARLVGRGITAIICASDPLALGAIRAVRRLGLSVPEDISVVGYDDSALMTCTDPPLTTIRQPIDAMGRAAVKLLSSQIDGTMASGESLLFEPELVVRGSTAPPRRCAYHGPGDTRWGQLADRSLSATQPYGRDRRDNRPTPPSLPPLTAKLLPSGVGARQRPAGKQDFVVHG
jgi:hypothetical protein